MGIPAKFQPISQGIHESIHSYLCNFNTSRNKCIRQYSISHCRRCRQRRDNQPTDVKSSSGINSDGHILRGHWNRWLQHPLSLHHHLAVSECLQRVDGLQSRHALCRIPASLRRLMPVKSPEAETIKKVECKTSLRADI